MRSVMAPKGISHLEFRIATHEYEEMKRRLTEAGFHAYHEVFRDADRNLFHCNLDR